LPLWQSEPRNGAVDSAS